MKNVTIVAKNRNGLLADISYILGKAAVNIKGLNVEIVGENALVTLLVKDGKKATTVLESNNYNTAALDAIVIKISQRLGGMEKITNILSKSRVKISEVHNLSSHEDEKVLGILVDRPRKATRMLSEFMLTAY